MKIEANKLESVLKKVVQLVPRRPTLPALENLVFEPDGDTVSLRATDLTTEVRVAVPARAAFALCIPARPLLDFISSGTDGDVVRFGVNGRTVSISIGRDTLELPHYPPQEFSKPFKHVAGDTGHAKTEPFVEALRWVSRALSTDPTRPSLTGLLLDRDKLVATDGHRLHVSGVEGFRCPTALIAGSAAAFLIKALRDEHVSIDVAKETVRFQTSTSTVTMKRIEAAFPAWEQVVPERKQACFTMRLAANDLEAGVKRVAKRSAKVATPVRVRANGAIKLEAVGEDTKATTTVQVLSSTHEGPDHVTGFNARYLSEALAGLGEIELRFHGTDAPAVIDDGKNLAVVMPFRI